MALLRRESSPKTKPGPVTLWEQLESLPNLDTFEPDSVRNGKRCSQLRASNQWFTRATIGEPTNTIGILRGCYKGIRGFDEKQQRMDFDSAWPLSRSVVSQVRARQLK